MFYTVHTFHAIHASHWSLCEYCYWHNFIQENQKPDIMYETVVSGFYFKYKNISHPFYQEVYRAAYTLDPTLADEMDACVIK